jgi:hypothetical protein
MMIPEPSKRGFGYPLGVDALPYLVRPQAGHRFSRPFKDCHGNVVTWNGALGVRIRTALPDGIEFSPVPFEAIDYCLPWPEPEEAADAERWRLLDDVAGQVWRLKPKAAFIEVSGREGLVGNALVSVQVGMGAVVPVSLLQIAARLPRCRVGIDNQRGGPLRFIWHGGEAIIRHVEQLPEPGFAIFAPKKAATGYLI